MPSRFISAIEIFDILHAFDRVIRHKTLKLRHKRALLPCLNLHVRCLESHKALHILTILLYYHNERRKLNEIEKLLEKMNHYKNSGMKDPFKDLSLYIIQYILEYQNNVGIFLLLLFFFYF